MSINVFAEDFYEKSRGENVALCCELISRHGRVLRLRNLTSMDLLGLWSGGRQSYAA